MAKRRKHDPYCWVIWRHREPGTLHTAEGYERTRIEALRGLERIISKRSRSDRSQYYITHERMGGIDRRSFSLSHEEPECHWIVIGVRTGRIPSTATG